MGVWRAWFWTLAYLVAVISVAAGHELSTSWNQVLDWSRAISLGLWLTVFLVSMPIMLGAGVVAKRLVGDSVLPHALQFVGPAMAPWLAWNLRRKPGFREDHAVLTYSFNPDEHEDHLYVTGRHPSLRFEP